MRRPCTAAAWGGGRYMWRGDRMRMRMPGSRSRAWEGSAAAGDGEEMRPGGGLALLRTSGDWMGGVTDGAPRYLLRPRARSPFFVPRIEVALVNWEAPV
jgi:hypothetical protein